MNGILSYILSYGGMATVGLLAAAGCAALIGVREKLDWPVLFPILSLSLLPLYLGAKLFGVLSLMTYRLGLHAPVTLGSLIEDSGIVFYGGMLFFLLGNVLLFVVDWLGRGKVQTAYALAYDVLRQQESEPEKPAPKNLPWDEYPTVEE